MQNLNALIPSDSGLRITSAIAINNNGRILAQATTASNEKLAVILSPVSSTNRTPIAQPDGQFGEYVMDEDSGSITLPVLANDTDPARRPLSMVPVSMARFYVEPENGTVRLSAMAAPHLHTDRTSRWISFVYYRRMARSPRTSETQAHRGRRLGRAETDAPGGAGQQHRKPMRTPQRLFF
jgi:hypothetical protein